MKVSDLIKALNTEDPNASVLFAAPPETISCEA